MTTRKSTILKNSTGWTDSFLKKMLKWVSKEVGLDRPLVSATFRKRNTNLYSGCGGSGRIVVSIRESGPWPTAWDGYVRACLPADGSEYIQVTDAIECLVILTAHETAHVWHFRRGVRGRGCEDVADARARYVLRLFRKEREALLASWNAERENPIETVPNPDTLKTEQENCQDHCRDEAMADEAQAMRNRFEEIPPEVEVSRKQIGGDAEPVQTMNGERNGIHIRCREIVSYAVRDGSFGIQC